MSCETRDSTSRLFFDRDPASSQVIGLAAEALAPVRAISYVEIERNVAATNACAPHPLATKSSAIVRGTTSASAISAPSPARPC